MGGRCKGCGGGPTQRGGGNTTEAGEWRAAAPQQRHWQKKTIKQSHEITLLYFLCGSFASAVVSTASGAGLKKTQQSRDFVSGCSRCLPRERGRHNAFSHVWYKPFWKWLVFSLAARQISSHLGALVHSPRLCIRSQCLVPPVSASLCTTLR